MLRSSAWTTLTNPRLRCSPLDNAVADREPHHNNVNGAIRAEPPSHDPTCDAETAPHDPTCDAEAAPHDPTC
ncbi:MAG: hypothetical protein ABJE95_31775, partial [Byssovorax sp.]